MEKKCNRLKIFVLLFSSLFYFCSYSQVSITGPVCVKATTEYQYIISGLSDSTQRITLCINGGTIAGTDSTCRSASVFSFIRIVWNSSTGGTITISGTAGNASLYVSMSQDLVSGQIDSLSRMQIVKTGNTPATIVCAPATGGNCSPQYKYQWQQSSDGTLWNDTVGAVSQNLQFSAILAQSTYYRRKTTESGANTDVFSNTAMVLVNP